jgi:hypothetical protein
VFTLLGRDAQANGAEPVLRPARPGGVQGQAIPEDAYEVLRRRARGHGQSMQAYMREQVLALAGRPSKN